MTLRDNKMAVLRQLGLEPDPIGLPELLLKLGEGFKERSVRRWLSLLVAEGAVARVGRKKGTKYIVNRDEKGSTKEVSSCFSSASLNAIQVVQKPLFDRRPVAYDPKWLASYKPNKTYYLSLHLRQQLFEVGRRTNGQDPAGTYAHQIFNRLIIDLSYNSSRLECNTYSLLDTERLLLQGDSVEGKLDGEKVMILNHKEAIRYLVDNAPNLILHRNVLCTLHYLLADGLVDPADAGKIRKQGVRIGGSTYLPYEDPKRLEKLLEMIAEKGAQIENPFEQSFFLLVHVSYLQAFVDVNKRTARLAANIALIRKNLVPLAFSDVRREDYLSATIAIYELQDVRPLIDLYVYSYMRTAAAYDATVKSMGFDEIRIRYRQQRRTLLREIILSKKTGHTLQHFIEIETQKMVPEQDRKLFMEDVHDDLLQMDASRLAGLGVTEDELKLWKMLG